MIAATAPPLSFRTRWHGAHPFRGDADPLSSRASQKACAKKGLYGISGGFAQRSQTSSRTSRTLFRTLTLKAALLPCKIWILANFQEGFASPSQKLASEAAMSTVERLKAEKASQKPARRRARRQLATKRKKAALCVGRLLPASTWTCLLKRPRLDMGAEALDDVALLHVVVILEAHAAFLTSNHLTDLVLEALERRKLTFVDHHVVANETHVRPALDLAICDAAARDLPDLRDVEHFEDLRISEELFARDWRE